MKNTINVFFDRKDIWGIKTNKSKVWLKKFSSKEKAMIYATKIAKRRKNKLVIHREDGTVYSIDTFCENPFPPRVN
jgi:hypothetical protein